MITMQYALDYEDHWQTRLYINSKNKKLKARRQKIWLLWTFNWTILGYVFYHYNIKWMAYYFFVMAILWLFFYPLYQRLYYKHWYRKWFEEKSDNKENLINSIRITEDFIETKNKTCTSEINISEMTEIIETADYFYLKLQTNKSYAIIPKTKIENASRMRDELKQLTEKLKIQFTEELKWKKISY